MEKTSKQKQYLYLSTVLRITGFILFLAIFIWILLNTFLLLKTQVRIEVLGDELIVHPAVALGVQFLPLIVASIILLSIGQFFAHKYRQSKIGSELIKLEGKLHGYVHNLGVIFIALSPVIFIATPYFLTDIICGTNYVSRCGFVNLGLLLYQLSYSVLFAVIGIVLISFFQKSANR